MTGDPQRAQQLPTWALIRQARRRRGWSQGRLAQVMLEVGRAHNRAPANATSLKTMLSRWENGKRLPDQFNRRLLSLALRVDPSELRLTLDPFDDW
jgi:transcriptional regulator with XRE-family HTH domain